jgi:DNA-binding NarL/FixJ family response regulator
MNRLLLIDSNTFFRQALRDILSFKFPFLIIEEAESGWEGRQKITQFRPQLVFMDIQFPEEDGFQIACQIQAENPAIIVVIFTTYNLEEYQTAALHAGIKQVIPKNIWSGQGILALVEALLSGPTKKHPSLRREAGVGEKTALKDPQKQQKEERVK